MFRKDVRLPIQLQRAMAAEAEAARESRAKVMMMIMRTVMMKKDDSNINEETVNIPFNAIVMMIPQTDNVDNSNNDYDDINDNEMLMILMPLL